MAESRDYRPADAPYIWLVYVGIALLAFSVLVWRMATLPLVAGRETDGAGLTLVAVLTLIAGLITAATGALQWGKDRRNRESRRTE